MKETKHYTLEKEYAFIGDGPAAILAIIALLKAGVSEKDILWVGQDYKVGALGKQWRGVPGNTDVGKYLKVYNEIFTLLKDKYGIKRREFMLDYLQENYPCRLKTAAEPLQHITHILRHLVTAKEGCAVKLNYTRIGLELVTQESQGNQTYLVQKAIVAIGAKSKTIPLPLDHQHKNLSLEIALDLELLRKWFEYKLKEDDTQKFKFAIVGSSHSAALAVMNLYQIMQEKNISVNFTQFANKEYQFAHNGMFDNTGLKGKVAIFMKKLMATGWKPIIGAIENFDEFTHIISATGLEAAATLQINGTSSDKISYDSDTGSTAVPGVFMAGSGHPRMVVEQGKRVGNVGISKFPEDFKKTVTAWTAPSLLRAAL